MKKLPQTVPELAEFLAKGITKNFVRTDADLADIKREIEGINTALEELRELVVASIDAGPPEDPGRGQQEAQ